MLAKWSSHLPGRFVLRLLSPCLSPVLRLTPMPQVVEDGYEFFAKRHLVTLFSAPNYCGEFDNAGAMMSVDETLLCSFQVRRSAPSLRESILIANLVTDIEARREEGEVSVRWCEHGTARDTATQAEEEGRQQDGLRLKSKVDDVLPDVSTFRLVAFRSRYTFPSHSLAPVPFFFPNILSLHGSAGLPNLDPAGMWKWTWRGLAVGLADADSLRKGWKTRNMRKSERTPPHRPHGLRFCAHCCAKEPTLQLETFIHTSCPPSPLFMFISRSHPIYYIHASVTSFST